MHSKLPSVRGDAFGLLCFGIRKRYCKFTKTLQRGDKGLYIDFIYLSRKSKIYMDFAKGSHDGKGNVK
jgi:hypothetical protein